MELTQPSYELCIHITYIHWYGSTECLAYAAVAAAECAAPRGTDPHILLVLRAQSRRRCLATKAFTLSTANGALLLLKRLVFIVPTGQHLQRINESFIPKHLIKALIVFAFFGCSPHEFGTYYDALAIRVVEFSKWGYKIRKIFA